MTCQASLSVRNNGLLGKIVACPRCGSMVEVQLPAQGISETTPEVATAGAQEEPAQAAAAGGAADAFATRAAGAVIAAAKSYKLATVSLAGIVVGATLLGLVLLRSDDQPVSATSIDDPLVDPDRETVNAPPRSASPAAPAQKTLTEPMSPEVPQAKAPAPPPAPRPATSAAQPGADGQPEHGREARQPAAAGVIPDAPQHSAIAAQQDPPAARKFNPLDFDAENLDLAALSRKVDGQAAEVEPPVAPASATAAPEEATEEATKEIAPATLVVRRSPEADTAIGGRDAAAGLGQVIPALKFKAMPLEEFLRLIGHLSGVPVSVAPDQLLMAGITLSKVVSLEATDISLNTALRRILEPFHLQPIAQDGQVIVVHSEATKVREINYPIEDLVDASTSAKRLAHWAQVLIAPATWKSAGGNGSLEIKPGTLAVLQEQHVHYQLLIFLDQLRLARKIPVKSRFPVERLVGTSPWLAVDAELSAPVTFTFSQFTSLDEIFGHWRYELGVPLIVDWPSLANQQLWPQTRIACAIVDQSWRAALDQVLQPLGLSWRAVAGGMIEITSTEKYNHELQLEVLPLHRRLSDLSTDLEKELQAVVEEQNAAAIARAITGPVGNAPGRIEYDATGSVLLSLHPAAVERRIVRLLLDRKLVRNEPLN